MPKLYVTLITPTPWESYYLNDLTSMTLTRLRTNRVSKLIVLVIQVIIAINYGSTATNKEGHVE